MYKSVFQSSKMALIFAGLTLVSAVSMVGTSDSNGLVTGAVDKIESGRATVAEEAKAYADAKSEGDAPPPPVFGEYGASAAPGSPVAGGQPRPTTGPMNAPRSATARTVADGAIAQQAVPYISDRDMTIEPR